MRDLLTFGMSGTDKLPLGGTEIFLHFLTMKPSQAINSELELLCFCT